MNNPSAENRLIHSNSAISVTHQFYDCQIMVYVEGDDDVPFWNELFQKRVPVGFYKIEQVGGKNNLKYYINAIRNNEISNVIVACDSDYNQIVSDEADTPLIIRTYGHSIENSMFCPLMVSKFIRNTIKTTDDYNDQTEEWYNKFCGSTMKLVPFDILNQEEDFNKDDTVKKRVLNERFFRLQDPNEKTLLSEDRINSFIDTIKANFLDSDIEEITNTIRCDKREPRYIIQGHFLEIAVMNYIRETIKKSKKVTLSNDAIFTNFIDCNIQCNALCKDKQFLFLQIDKAYSYFNK